MSEINTEIALLKLEMKNISDKVDTGFAKLEKALETNSQEHKDMFAKFEASMEKKAGKWVENVLVWGGSVIGVAILGAFLRLIILQ